LKILLATTSAGKLREQKEALAGLDIEIVTLEAFGDVAPPEETGSSFRENAATKALYYNRRTGLAAVGEDAGLSVDALSGEPGVHSARWLGAETSYEVKNARLLEMLEGVSREKRTARYVSAVALAVEGAIVFEYQGRCEGLIALAPRGEGGFGYDPIFHHPESGKTMAEMSPAEKSALSHRGKALRALRTYLERALPPPIDARSGGTL
jgi:XTP/dITP diphosphohydrolase